MAELFIVAYIGHLVGDFLLQPKWMALRKSEKTTDGRWICTIHVITYTLALLVAFAVYGHYQLDLIVVLGIAIPHWIIDHWSLANKWLGLIGGRTFEAAAASTNKHREFDVAFTCIVYAETDKALHLISLFVLIALYMT